MRELEPFETLFSAATGDVVDLPAALSEIYGSFQLAHPGDGPRIVANFVSTLDGVVSLGESGRAGGSEISGFNQHDRLLMGLLRAVADAVIVGAGTLRSVPGHVWTSSYVFPSLASTYEQLRTSLGKTEPPLNVIVTAKGEVDLNLRVFRSGEVASLIVTTPAGARLLSQAPLPQSVNVAEVPGDGNVGVESILRAVERQSQARVILVEGGPHLLGDFLFGKRIDELFLTLAPQIAGRDSKQDRPALVEGTRFAPENPLWGNLVGVKRASSHLFLRYAFESKSVRA